MILYHRTSAAIAERILCDGFRDGVGTYMTSDEHSGVWLSNVPLDVNEGAPGDTLLRLELPEQIIASYEWIEKGKPYREWLIPAQLINEKAGSVCVIDEDATIDKKKQLAEFIENDYEVVRRYRIIANSPDRGPEERRDAVATIQGHMLRIGMLEAQLAQFAAAEERARQTGAARTAILARKEQRDKIVDAVILANTLWPVKKLTDAINTELAIHGLKAVSDDYVSKRRRKIGSTVLSN
ncbi:hypothetical protein [Bradyrhizobium japonicum]|uniref:hypothetical protein n=1 Tax=Bradyrhizobium japonicum TaxID=375 RepID=UPI001BAC9115|nr:hypothetical protein [Bradyrhizobium japonicum]MBR0914888.1 hypothetical protein [Bradyrhizobium japonicum]